MKFSCGLTKAEKERRRETARVVKHKYLSDWHPKFAWLPIRVGDFDCRWLEYVERKGKFWKITTWEGRMAAASIGYPSSGWNWEYRPMPPDYYLA